MPFMHAASVSLPSLPDQRSDKHLVYLPADLVMAEQLLFAWNAAVSTEQHIVINAVPTIEQIYVKRDADYSQWGDPGVNELYKDASTSLRFDLRQDDEFKNVYLLLAPHVNLQQRLQMFIDNTCLSCGISIPRASTETTDDISIIDGLWKIWESSGLNKILFGNYVMIAIGVGLLYLAIAKGFEPLLLVPIAAGCIFVNAVGANMGEEGGVLYYFYTYGIQTSIFPLLIFLGVGALTDFGPLLANPWMALLGGAAQFGIFGSFFIAVCFFGFSLQEAGAIAIIGGADGPTSIYVASLLAPELLGAVAVAAYSYMALVPIIQPPIMRLFTNDEERKIMMVQKKPVSKRAKIIFPIVVIIMCILTLPDAVPLIGMLMLGNLMKESGVVDRLSNAAQNELINLVTIGLGLSVGMKMSSDQFLIPETLGILFIGIVAFIVGTAAGVIMAKIMNKLSGGKINPLIGSAGVSAVPMAARVSQNEGAKYRKGNFLLMHAMGPNVAGVIGSAVAAGILLSLLR